MTDRNFVIKVRGKGYPGIYTITSQNGKIYVGSSKNLVARAVKHKSLLMRDVHPNAKLQASFNKYGRLVFESIYRCKTENLVEWEQIFIDTLKPKLNILQIAYSSKGYKHSKEALAKMSKAQKGLTERNEKLKKYYFKAGGDNPMKKGRIAACHIATSKPVLATNGDKQRRFRSSAATSRCFRVSEASIWRRLNGRTRSDLNGWTFVYI